MIKRIVWEWESLDSGTRRAKVMGGWVLQSHLMTKAKGVSMSESMIFISDPYHEWQIIPPYVDEKVERKNISKEFAA